MKFGLMFANAGPFGLPERATHLAQAAEALQAPELQPGDHLGPWLLGEPLGEGGMGTVWRVADAAQGGREVALKTIRATGAVTPAM